MPVELRSTDSRGRLPPHIGLHILGGACCSAHVGLPCLSATEDLIEVGYAEFDGES
jgi:hypothetical protein